MKIPALIESSISDFALVNKNQTILVGVSGGVDSIVLASGLHELGYKISIAHVNYKLRGKESDEDEDFTQKFAQELGVEFYSKTLAIEGESIQEEAREKRYEWFGQLCREKGYDHIALAHNANDNFETALFHLIKGEGILNHRGIPIRSEKTIRPLLFASRDQIEEYAKEKGLKWREDSSNRENKYLRNQLRNEVIPLLRKINPSLEETYKRDYRRELEIRKILLPILEFSKDWLLESEDSISIDLERLNESPGGFLSLEYFLIDFGYQSSQQDELRAFLDSKTGSKFIIGKTELQKDREKIFLVQEIPSAVGIVIDESDLPFSKVIGNRNLEISVSETNSGIEKKSEGEEWVDYSKISWPLSLRPWKPGDDFQPLGMSGRKKISDLLVDNKIPLHRKAGIHVLESSGEIVLVLGFAPSDKYKIESSTKAVLRVKIS